MGRTWWVLGLGWLWFSAPVWSQRYPDYIERQIRSGTLTREEAKILYGNPQALKTTPSTGSGAPAVPVTAPTEPAKIPDKKPKEPPYRGTMAGLQPSQLTAEAGVTLAGTVYVIKDSPEFQERLTRQINLVNKQKRTSGPSKIGRPAAPGTIGDVPAGTFGEATGGPGAALAQLPGFTALAGEFAVVSGPLKDDKFALEAALPTAVVMIIVTAGDRIIGVWSLPAQKDKPLEGINPDQAVYWVP